MLRKFALAWALIVGGFLLSIVSESRTSIAQNQYPMGVVLECWNGTNQYVPCSQSGGQPVAPSPYQGQASGNSQPQLAVSTGAVTTLTVPPGTLAFTVGVRTGGSAINYCIDGQTPTTGATGSCEQLSSGTKVWYSGVAYANAFKAIGATASTAIDVEYQK